MDHILSDLSTMARLSWVAPYGMATTPPRSGDVAERSNPMFKELQLCRCRRAERSYSMFKVRRGNLVQGKEQWLCFAGTAVKRYPMFKVRETQVR